MKEYVFNLKEVRLKKKLTQVELAEITGLKQQAISRYESGIKTPQIDTAARIAYSMGVTLDELVVIREAKKEIAEDLKKMLKS